MSAPTHLSETLPRTRSSQILTAASPCLVARRASDPDVMMLTIVTGCPASPSRRRGAASLTGPPGDDQVSMAAETGIHCRPGAAHRCRHVCWLQRAAGCRSDDLELRRIHGAHGDAGCSHEVRGVVVLEDNEYRLLACAARRDRRSRRQGPEQRIHIAHSLTDTNRVVVCVGFATDDSGDAGAVDAHRRVAPHYQSSIGAKAVAEIRANAPGRSREVERRMADGARRGDATATRGEARGQDGHGDAPCPIHACSTHGITPGTHEKSASLAMPAPEHWAAPIGNTRRRGHRRHGRGGTRPLPLLVRLVALIPGAFCWGGRAVACLVVGLHRPAFGAGMCGRDFRPVSVYRAGRRGSFVALAAGWGSRVGSCAIRVIPLEVVGNSGVAGV